MLRSTRPVASETAYRYTRSYARAMKRVLLGQKEGELSAEFKAMHRVQVMKWAEKEKVAMEEIKVCVCVCVSV